MKQLGELIKATKMLAEQKEAVNVLGGQRLDSRSDSIGVHPEAIRGRFACKQRCKEKGGLETRPYNGCRKENGQTLRRFVFALLFGASPGAVTFVSAFSRLGGASTGGTRCQPANVALQHGASATSK